MAEVDAIERTGGDDASRAFREMGKTVVKVHCVKGRERFGGVGETDVGGKFMAVENSLEQVYSLQGEREDVLN